MLDNLQTIYIIDTILFFINALLYKKEKYNDLFYCMTIYVVFRILIAISMFIK
jgi:hypothetical protein